MRLLALDSLRGLAALSVVLYHSLLVFPDLHAMLEGRGVPYATSGEISTLLMTVTPPSLFWAGREAVLLFFVLSGFVLSLAFEGPRHRRPGILAFAAKRTLRLLPPCAVVALLLGLLVPLIGPQPLPGLSDWVNASWSEPVTPGLVAGHALLLRDDYTLNNPMWTLHYELRISLLFPLLVMLAAAGGAVLAVAVAAGVLLCLVEMKFAGSGALTILLFVPHFALGLLLARQREALAGALARLGPAPRLALWLACYALLTFRWLVPAGPLACDLANGAGAGLLIALVLASRRTVRVLEWRPLRGLGAISYSLYLVHVPVLLAGLHLLHPVAPVPLVAAGAPLVSVLLAAGLYRLVERPSIALGRQGAAWIERRVATGRALRASQ